MSFSSDVKKELTTLDHGKKCCQLAQIAGHMMEHHHFAIDPLRTVFYGTCEDCTGK